MNRKTRTSRSRNVLLVGIILTSCVLLLIVLFSRMEETIPQSNLVLAAEQTDAGAVAEGYMRATGPVALEFPQDFGPHPDFLTEWWYYTGNLATAEKRHFGYQLTFFRRALLPPADRQARPSDWAVDQVYMAHFALTDTAGNQHHAFEKLARGAAGVAGAQAQPYQVWLKDWRVVENGPEQYLLTASQDGLAIELTMKDIKGPILNGDNGYSQKGPDPGNASYYYSLTRLQTQGSITIDGAVFQVNGFSWKDHEYSTSALSGGQIGWDWFSIQLDDFSELMVYQIRRDDGTIDPYSSGTLINAEGITQHLDWDEFEIEVLDTWKSPHTGANYPARWLLSVPETEIELEIMPHLVDQEMNLSYAYWEGAVSVSGQKDGQPVLGNGYVELSGYAGSLSGEF
jgi:predicted secreted hydrolase